MSVPVYTQSGNWYSYLQLKWSFKRHLCGFRTLPITLQNTLCKPVAILFTGERVLPWLPSASRYPAAQCLHGFQNRVLEKGFQNGKWQLTSCPARSLVSWEVPSGSPGAGKQLTNRDSMWPHSEIGQVPRSSKTSADRLPFLTRGLHLARPE